MKTILINIEDKSNAEQLIEAIKLLKGVKDASIATDEQLENVSILNACKAARKTAVVLKQEIFTALQ